MGLFRFRFVWSTLLAAILFGTGALAQQTAPVANPPAPPPAAAQPSPVAVPPAKGNTTPVGPTSLRDAPLDTVLDMLERLTGRSVIRPQALPPVAFTLTTHTTMSSEDFTLALESLLSINGIGVAPLGDKFLTVVPIQNLPKSAPELVVGSLKDEPPSGKVVSKLFRLNYLDSQAFQTQIQPFLSPFGTIVPFQNSNAVIVTDTVVNLQRLEYVVNEVDKPTKLNIETRFYALQYAKASDVVNELHTLIETARSGFGNNATATAQQLDRRLTRGNGRPGDPLTRELERAAENASAVPLSIIAGANTSINSDERTNQIIVITDPANLPFFDNIIQKLDIPAEPPTHIEVYTLDHADATEVASILSQFVSGRSGAPTTTQNRSSGSTSGFSSGLVGSNTNMNRNNNNRNNNRNNNNSNATGSQQTAIEAVRSTLDQEGSQFSQYMTIVADERSNSLVISGTNQDTHLIDSIVKKLDVLLAQVRIQVVIAEVTLTNGQTRGIDSFSGSATLDRTNGTNNVSVNNFSMGLGPISISKGAAAFTDGTLTNLSLDAVFNAAKTNDNVKILSAPTIVTTHNKEASILVGESRPFITSTQTALDANGVERATVQYEDVGINLKVKPLIGPNDVIQMDIDQSVDNVTSTQQIGGADQPIISRRQATSFVSVKNNQMIVLGGLQSDQLEHKESRMFILGDIPVLGELFRKKVLDHHRTELLVFIRPTIIRTTDEANADAEKSIDSLSDPAAVRNFYAPGSVPPAPAPTSPPESHFHKN